MVGPLKTCEACTVHAWKRKTARYTAQPHTPFRGHVHHTRLGVSGTAFSRRVSLPPIRGPGPALGVGAQPFAARPAPDRTRRRLLVAAATRLCPATTALAPAGAAEIDQAIVGVARAELGVPRPRNSVEGADLALIARALAFVSRQRRHRRNALRRVLRAQLREGSAPPAVAAAATTTHPAGRVSVNGLLPAARAPAEALSRVHHPRFRVDRAKLALLWRGWPCVGTIQSAARHDTAPLT